MRAKDLGLSSLVIKTNIMPMCFNMINLLAIEALDRNAAAWYTLQIPVMAARCSIPISSMYTIGRSENMDDPTRAIVEYMIHRPIKKQ